MALFQGGLLHTKSITVDERFSLFGSLNLDPRSLRLDFEITLAVYELGFTRDLRQLQQHYLDRSKMLDLAACRACSRSSASRRMPPASSDRSCNRPTFRNCRRWIAEVRRNRLPPYGAQVVRELSFFRE